MIKRTICIENPCHLKCRNDQLVVDYHHVKGYENVPEKTVPIEDIGMLVLEHQQITISHYLLDKLVANNAAVITCNETHHPSGIASADKKQQPFKKKVPHAGFPFNELPF